MGSNFKITYSVDMVFCIDCTGSMDNIINIVKDNALNFYQDLTAAMDAKSKKVSQLRVRVVAFRDYQYDLEDAMLVTDFFNLPEQAEDFERCVRSLEAKGGGDDPEDGLEALAYAIKSKWNTEGVKKRQVIVVWTDDATHPLGFGKVKSNGAPNEFYPNGMAQDLNELASWWGGGQYNGFMDNNAKRLLLYAPDAPDWSSIARNWDNVLHFPSEADSGLTELEYNEIISTITNTI